MKIFQTLLLFILPLAALSQNDTIIYFGINGTIDEIDTKKIKKVITWRSKKNLTVETFRFSDEKWNPVYTEKIKLKKDSVYEIKIKGKEFSDEITRVYKSQNGKLKFIDLKNDQIKRTGFTSSKIPLILEGEVTEYYDNGNKKSESVFKNNELISNKNWLENGDPYIDNIFYSVDAEPLFLEGIGHLHNHILRIFKASNLDYSKLEGILKVGFVVMENGRIDGVKIDDGIHEQMDQLAINAFKTLMGEWKPAVLDGENVRYYQVFPINFIHTEYEYDYVEIRGGTLYYQIN